MEMLSLLSRTKLATFSAEPRGWYYCLPAPSMVSPNLPVLLRAASFTMQSCRDLMPQSSHLEGGERKDAFPLPSPTIAHKHFRAMQGRKPCLAVTPTPLETFSHSSSLSCSLQEESCISALKPYWDRTGINPRQPGGLGSCEARTDLSFSPSVSGS